jgi:hypothetical protein
MTIRRAHLPCLLLCLLPIASGCGWTKRKPYSNDPMLRLNQPIVDNAPAAGAATAEAPRKPWRPFFLREPRVAIQPKQTPRPNVPQPDGVPTKTDTSEPPMADAPRGPLLPVPGGLNDVPRVHTPPAMDPVERESNAGPRPLPVLEQAGALAKLETPVVVQQDDETYGRGPDYRWLRGVLDVHHRGDFRLRYADASADDRFGGKVRLSDDQQLRDYRDGDVLFIEGELVPNSGSGTRGDYPLYRILSVRRVREAK